MYNATLDIIIWQWIYRFTGVSNAVSLFASILLQTLRTASDEELIKLGMPLSNPSDLSSNFCQQPISFRTTFQKELESKICALNNLFILYERHPKACVANIIVAYSIKESNEATSLFSTHMVWWENVATSRCCGFT